ncbi:hypothetical protein ABWK46_06940 [Peribacillus frigoritolerans]|jgi:hypothetical protein
MKSLKPLNGFWGELEMIDRKLEVGKEGEKKMERKKADYPVG